MTAYEAPRVENATASDGVARRITRAKEIASHPETIEKLGEVEWSVPSQSGFGRYRVWFVEREGRCTCPDYAKRAASCKHIYAVLDLKLREAGQSLAAPERKARKQYRQHPSYTKGQTEEMRLVDSFLHDLLAEVDDFPRVPGARGPAPARRGTCSGRRWSGPAGPWTAAPPRLRRRR